MHHSDWSIIVLLIDFQQSEYNKYTKNVLILIKKEDLLNIILFQRHLIPLNYTKNKIFLNKKLFKTIEVTY